MTDEYSPGNVAKLMVLDIALQYVDKKGHVPNGFKFLWRFARSSEFEKPADEHWELFPTCFNQDSLRKAYAQMNISEEVVRRADRLLNRQARELLYKETRYLSRGYVIDFYFSKSSIK